MDPIKSIGKTLTAPEQRDAIHIAIAPVEAAVALKPGQHVGTDGHGRIGTTRPYIGVVDPYLRAPVKAGDKVWLFLYPGTITSLRHEWTHPDLKAPGETSKSHSEKWMRAWAMKHVSEDYYGDGEKPVSEDAAYAFAIRVGHEHCIGPYESARDHIDNEWWGHWEAITGVQGERDTYFSCSC